MYPPPHTHTHNQLNTAYGPRHIKQYEEHFITIILRNVIDDKGRTGNVETFRKSFSIKDAVCDFAAAWKCVAPAVVPKPLKDLWEQIFNICIC